MKSRGKQAAKPKLRFPEFRDAADWDRRKLSDLLVETKQRNRQLAYGPSDVLSVSGEYGCVNQIDLLGRSFAGVSVKDYHIVEIGDVVYTKSPLKRNPYGIIRTNKGRPGIVSTLYAVYRATEICDPDFLDHYFSRDYHLNRYLQPLVKKGAKNDMKVNNTVVLSGDIWAPKLGEQQKITRCLTSLDELIAAHGQKLGAFKAHRKGLMQQLFPAEGKTIPARRFPEFRKAKAWTKRKVSEVLSRVSMPITVDETTLYREIGVRSHGKGIFHKEPISGAELGDKRVFRVVEDALVLNIVFAWEQAVATTSKEETGMIASHRFPMYVPKSEQCDVRFVKNAFLTPQGKHLLGIASPGGAGRNRTLGQDEFENLSIALPDLDEQIKITDTLRAADDLITFQAAEIETLKRHKKGLIQQLFPSPEDIEA
jgi:type I restriction enzyme, S subunit